MRAKLQADIDETNNKLEKTLGQLEDSMVSYYDDLQQHVYCDTKRIL